MMNNKVSFTNSNNPTISLSAVIYFPPKFDETRQYPAIVVSHPGGGVKEQTAGTYAEKLAERDLSLLLMTHLIKVKAAASRVS
ncbi:hypothetical protein AC93_1479 [Escherichia coli 2-005-03_S4_C2]|jgi:fermentation-respiration switch protein FrsA (DUF1100 family)|uniref:Hydrolase n=1 Tax=Escherichia coli TaxID=562 RepID=A0A376DI11_ECOLX|nr:hypothetical protein A13I_04066 [Escherichia coli KTE186]EZJ43472.1 hypothetical protein AD23_1497 [Escherichia coli 2-005-03_S4_C3]EZJ52839.1 hypothetical protein AC93_1479 [Escherichia coli 2-005-03_S4_C2]KDT28404.1 hypothetical protein AC67_1552 [Escherichia coli 2-052-05_S4_C1]STC89859.1 hydrolase [Escherichia coli]